MNAGMADWPLSTQQAGAYLGGLTGVPVDRRKPSISWRDQMDANPRETFLQLFPMERENQTARIFSLLDQQNLLTDKTYFPWNDKYITSTGLIKGFQVADLKEPVSWTVARGQRPVVCLKCTITDALGKSANKVLTFYQRYVASSGTWIRGSSDHDVECIANRADTTLIEQLERLLKGYTLTTVSPSGSITVCLTQPISPSSSVPHTALRV